jgi:hypothetical protein
LLRDGAQHLQQMGAGGPPRFAVQHKREQAMGISILFLIDWVMKPKRSQLRHDDVPPRPIQTFSKIFLRFSTN